ncbi:hypothetical protein AQ870_08985 [Burkholderia pseudomallei]|nr:hypothetical protein AQ870_08985 [Burkholderia pseudomallei]OND38776.1 hypothetical protein AQ931_26715 [Burkholderia pseudomallei]OND46405.1 hypothetical protein AQ933_21395 [Burkholderia pseudomallei]
MARRAIAQCVRAIPFSCRSAANRRARGADSQPQWPAAWPLKLPLQLPLRRRASTAAHAHGAPPSARVTDRFGPAHRRADIARRRPPNRTTRPAAVATE